VADRESPGKTSIGAGILILALTALFSVIGIDLARNALDPSQIDRETLLTAFGLGLTPEETQNLTGLTAILILVLCALTTILGIGVLLRREGVRHAAIGTFFIFAAVTIPLAFTGMVSDEPSGSVWVGFLIGVTDAGIVALLLHAQTLADFQRAEAARQRGRSARRARRAARRSRGASLAVAALLLLSLTSYRPPASAAAPLLAPYRGLATWVDIYDDPAWADPEGTVAAMEAVGVRTLFLETSNWRRNRDIVKPKVVARFIEAAHLHGLMVVGWYLPSFAHPKVDFRRSMAAVNLETPTGQRFDSFALDIEASEVADPARRSRRLLDLSADIREAVGSSYALGAIVPNPVRLEIYPDRWPGFPYAGLAEHFDAFVPMGYFAYDASGESGAYDYTARIIQIIRERSGDPSAPIHVIGGIADDINQAEARGFVAAVGDNGVLGASLYDFMTSDARDWIELASVPA
jgi:hypothetical protein